MAYTFDLNELNQYTLEDYAQLSKTIQFEACLHFLEKTGRITYGKHFALDLADYKVIFQLLVYFYTDFENAERLGIELHKGILLSGPIGCGKTSLLFLLRYMLARDKQYIMKDCRTIGMEFIKDGYPVIEKYSTHAYYKNADNLHPKTYCFDDLGMEPNYKHFGNEANVMAEILMSRYPLFIHQKMKTHATTNLSSDELEKLYGNRVRSRMREMFNLVHFDTRVADKRK